MPGGSECFGVVGQSTNQILRTNRTNTTPQQLTPERVTAEFVGRKLKEEGNELTEEELEKKAGKEGFSESRDWSVYLCIWSAWSVCAWVHVYMCPYMHHHPLLTCDPNDHPTTPPAFVAEDDTKKHYDVLMGLDLVLEEEELEVKYK